MNKETNLEKAEELVRNHEANKELMELGFGCEVNVCRDYDSFTSEQSVDYKLKAKITYVEKTDDFYEGGGEIHNGDKFIYKVEFDKYCGDEEPDVEEDELEILGKPAHLEHYLRVLGYRFFVDNYGRLYKEIGFDPTNPDKVHLRLDCEFNLTDGKPASEKDAEEFLKLVA